MSINIKPNAAEFFTTLFVHLLAGTAQSGKKLTIGWMAWGSNPGGSEIFHACPDWPWSSPTLL